MQAIYLQHTKEDLRILARQSTAAVVANAHADRADAAIMHSAQRYYLARAIGMPRRGDDHIAVR